jgi:hypothetical protein
MPLPTFVVIGAAKSGTTSLHRYLDLHPEIAMSTVKETGFFSDDRLYAKGPDWYAQLFPDAPARGEATPDYSGFPDIRGVPERMHALLPDAKLIYLVRDPVPRIVSQWMDHYADGALDRDIETELTRDSIDRVHEINVSRYWLQLEQYLRFYAPEQLLVVASEDLLEQRRETLREIFCFLGVAADFDSPALDRVHNPGDVRLRKRGFGYRIDRVVRPLRRRLPGGRVPAWAVRLKRLVAGLGAAPVERPVLSPELRSRLEEHLRPEMERLRAFTGKPFADWSI